MREEGNQNAVEGVFGNVIYAYTQKRDVQVEDFTIRLLRQGQGSFTPSADEILQEGDRLSCVPLKIEGAHRS